MQTPGPNPAPPVIFSDGCPPAVVSRWVFVFLAGLLAVGTLIVFQFDPSAHSFYPMCPLHQLTGLHCSGCGSLRALHRLTHGDVAGALQLNSLLVFSLAAAAVLAVHQRFRKWSGRPVTTEFPLAWYWLWFGFMVAFGVLRNLPGCGWLAP